MMFNSIEFLIFFPLVTIIYFVLPHRFRWLFLLGASYYFYMSWRPEYILLILFLTVVNYVIGRTLENETLTSRRKMLLLLSLCTNLGLLFVFKYSNFFAETLQVLLAKMNIDYTPPGYEILLPVGISFYTFQILSYTIDVFRGKQNPEHHFGKFALFVAFFPKLVAGPIERSNRLFPQFNLVQRIDYDRIVSGLRLMTWGFFVKLVIADRLADTVNLVYNNPRDYQGIPLIIATFFFAIQIYCDFSGYSYIAIGAAKILGFDLMENFRRPYFAKSFSEFWSRWHISLSTWFRDYLYIPLGGNRVKVGRWFANLMIVFLISGLWHGANWTFVVWGALHGGYLVATIITGFIFDRRTPGPDRIRKCGRIISVLQILLTFSLVLFAWIFFRANSISDAFYIAGHLFRGIQLQSGYGLNLGGAYEMAIIAVGLLTLFIVDLLIERGYTWELVSRRPVYVRWLIYYALIFSIILLGKFQVTEFIYSQF